MTRRESIDFRMAYLGGELPPARRAAFDERLEIGEARQRWLGTSDLETSRGTIAPDRAACAADDAGPDGVPEVLVQAVLAVRATRDA